MASRSWDDVIDDLDADESQVWSPLSNDLTGRANLDMQFKHHLLDDLPGCIRANLDMQMKHHLLVDLPGGIRANLDAQMKHHMLDDLPSCIRANLDVHQKHHLLNDLPGCIRENLDTKRKHHMVDDLQVCIYNNLDDDASEPASRRRRVKWSLCTLIGGVLRALPDTDHMHELMLMDSDNRRAAKLGHQHARTSHGSGSVSSLDLPSPSGSTSSASQSPAAGIEVLNVGFAGMDLGNDILATVVGGVKRPAESPLDEGLEQTSAETDVRLALGVGRTKVI